jgi:hypothetical protein
VAPREAARAAAASAFASLAPARAVLVGLVTWGDGPGLEPAPWTLDGVLAAATDVGVDVAFEPLGPHEAAATHRWLRAHARSRVEDRRAVTLEIPGARRTRRIPRPWIGRHLCLVTPCVHLGRPRLGRSASWVGPLAAAFEILASVTGAARPSDEQSSELGRRLAAQVFASTTLVLDASWWAPLVADAGRPSDPAASHLVALDRLLVMGTSAPAEQWARHGPQLLDAWLTMRLGVSRSPRSTDAHEDALRFIGPGAARGWPHPAAAGPERHRRGTGGRGLPSLENLANRFSRGALEALWRVSDSTRGRAAPLRLPAAVPGALARHWHTFGSTTRQA